MQRDNIPSYQDLVDLVQSLGACSMDDIVSPLELKSPDQASELQGRLGLLVKQGKLNCTDHGLYTVTGVEYRQVDPDLEP